MKKLLFLISALLCIYLLISLPGCTKVKELITGKDYGNYTSITVRITVNYKGLNSTGIRKLTLGGNVALNENYTIAGTATMDSTCEDAILDKAYSFDVTISTTTLNVISEFINWDYTKYKKIGTNVKMLCTEWGGSIVSYTYEDGKDDPGSPVISGFDLLNGFNIQNHCVADGRQHDCILAVDLTFSSAYTNVDKNAAEYVYAASSSTYID